MTLIILPIKMKNANNTVTTTEQAEFDQPPSYKVDVFGRLVYFQVRGLWTLGADIQWLSSISEQMNSMRGSPWFLLADMRSWVVPKDVVYSSLRAKHNVDRRNEVAECWWLNKDDDHSYLLTIKAHLPIHVSIMYEASEVRKWLEERVEIGPTIDDLLV